MLETLIEIEGGKRAIVLRDDAPSSRLRYGEDKGLPTNTEYALACALRDLRTAAKALYMAGRWTLTGPTAGCVDIDEAHLWANLRDALGLTPGTATALGIAAQTSESAS